MPLLQVVEDDQISSKKYLAVEEEELAKMIEENQENNPRPAPARPQPKTQMPESGNPVAAHQARPNTPMGAHRSSMATTAHSATTTDQMAR